MSTVIGDTYRKQLEIRRPKARSEQKADLTSNDIIAGNGMCKVYFVLTFILFLRSFKIITFYGDLVVTSNENH